MDKFDLLFKIIDTGLLVVVIIVGQNVGRNLGLCYENTIATLNMPVLCGTMCNNATNWSGKVASRVNSTPENTTLRFVLVEAPDYVPYVLNCNNRHVFTNITEALICRSYVN